MRSNQSRTEFMARVWLRDSEEVDSIEVWVHALEPIEADCRSAEEWVHEYLTELGYKWFLDEIPDLVCRKTPDNYQLLLRGEITGGYNDWTGEYDDNIYIRDASFCKLPADWWERHAEPPTEVKISERIDENADASAADRGGGQASLRDGAA